MSTTLHSAPPGRPRAPTPSFRIVFTILIGMISPIQAHGSPASSPEVPPGFTSQVVDVPGAKIHCVKGGSGPPVLLVHGWPETWYEWRKVMPALAKHHTVIAADLRGFGDSSLEPNGYDKKTLANDLHALMVKLGYPKAAVAGHDWGAPVAYAYAAQHRDAVERLVLIEGASFGPWSETLEPLWFFHLLRLPNGYAEKLVTGRERAFLSYFYDNREMHVVPAFDQDVIDVYSNAYSRPGRMAPSYGLYRTIEEDVRDNAAFSKKKLTIPVLAVGAEKGIAEGVIKSAQAVAASVTPLLFNHTGHFIPEERPEALSEAIESFLAGRPIPATWAPPRSHQ